MLLVALPLNRFFASVLLGLTLVMPIQAHQSKLVGRWDCYRQRDSAKISSCLYSIEFFPDGTLIQKDTSSEEVEWRCTYSIKGKRIYVKSGTGIRWNFGFRFLRNGDLFLSKPPWDWQGWLTKDSSRVPKDHGCMFIRPD
jgi:hypothetical protein